MSLIGDKFGRHYKAFHEHGRMSAGPASAALAAAARIAETIALMRENARSTVQGMDEVGERVDAGVERAREASDAIAAIRDSSGRAVNRVGDITSAIREQGIASTSIAQQVERIAQMSEENHAAAVNTSDTAGELDGLARKMKTVVSQYRI